jgi:hypothetical protein
MATLEHVLTKSRQLIQGALAEARAELDTLRARQTELEQLIAQAETALGDVSTSPKEGMTLHAALGHILRENNNEWMTARELADAVNAAGLYRKRDGSNVEVNQVHARTSNYSALFEKDGPNIRLREESPALETTPQGVAVFRDDDRGFFDWLYENPAGYFINTERAPKVNYLVLHQPQCPHFKREDSLHWTKDYVKVCSIDRAALEGWAAEMVGGEVTLCRSCFG